MRKTFLTLGCLVAFVGATPTDVWAGVVDMTPGGDVVTLNVALNKPTSGDVAFSFPTSNGNDGNLANFTHADNTNAAPNNPFWMVDLQGSFDLDSIVVYDRNGCCTPNRFNGSIVTVLDAGMNLLYESDAIAGLPDNNTTDLTRTFDNGGAGIAGASFIRVDGFTQFFQFAELEAFATTVTQPMPVNYALNAPVTASGPTWTDGADPAFAPAVLTDGSPATFTHALNQVSGNFSYEIDMGTPVEISQINIAGRGDGCCPERLSNYRVEVLDGSGTSVWSSDLRTDGSFPAVGGVEMIFDGLGTGTFVGQTIRITNLGSTDYGPQIAEVEVFGHQIPEPSSIALLGLALASLMLRRTRRRTSQIA